MSDGGTAAHDEVPAWAPPDVDLEHANVARIYDYYLGGDHNFAVDRVFAARAIELLPHARDVAKHNRRFAVRAVEYALDEGVDQFLDVGSGIPTVTPVHELVHERNPDAPVVYVDNEAVAIAHGTLLLEDDPHAAMVGGDFYEPATVLDNAAIRRLIDFDRPVCLTLVALLHFVPPGVDQAATLRRYVRALAPGSLVALSHATVDGLDTSDPEEAKLRDDTLAFCRYYENSTSPNFVTRTKDEFGELFDGLELVEPGIDYTQSWHDPHSTAADRPERCVCLAAVGRKR